MSSIQNRECFKPKAIPSITPKTHSNQILYIPNGEEKSIQTESGYSRSSAIWCENHIPIKLDLKTQCAGAVQRILFQREFANSRLVL